MSDHRDRALLVALVGLAIYQVASRFSTAEATPSKPDTYISVNQGSRINDSVVAGRHSEELSDIGHGSCQLVVLYSPTCGASVVAARQWARAKSADGDSALPPGWGAAWISTAAIGVADPVDTMDLPAIHGVAVDGDALAKHLAITAYPVFVILDREGKVTGSSVGAPLPGPDDDVVACRLTSRVGRQ